MCGRFCIAATPGEIRDRYFLSSLPPLMLPYYNVAITQPALIITSSDENRFLGKTAIWGFKKEITSQVTQIINLRSETIERTVHMLDKDHTTRCLIPATGFYEWKRENNKKIPHYIRRNDNALFSLAGLVSYAHTDPTNPDPSFIILTCPSERIMSDIHDRMPVIITQKQEMQYLSFEGKRAVPLSLHEMRAEMQDFTTYPVSPAVNNTKNNYPELIDPVAYTDTTQQRLW